MCHSQQEALDKSIGACTNNRAVSNLSTQATVKILLARLYFKVSIMLTV